MDIGYYLTILWRRKWGIILTVATALIILAAGSRLTPLTYKASSIIRVAVSAAATQNPSLYSYNDKLMNTFVQMATSDTLLKETQTRLSLQQLPKIEVQSIPNTELIQITAFSTTPQLAAQTANTLADLLIEQGGQIYSGTTPNTNAVLATQLEQAQNNLNTTRTQYEKLLGQTPVPAEKITITGQLLQEQQRTYETLLRQYEETQYYESITSGMVTQVESATPANAQTQTPGLGIYLAAAIVAFIAGVFLALFLERIDKRLHITSEIESTAHTPALAKLPTTTGEHQNILQNSTSTLATSVRHFAANLQLVNGQDEIHKVIVLMGAEPGQGVTTTVSNLGYVLAEQGRSVLLIDFNLYHPQLHQIFNTTNDHGLVDVLYGEMDIKEAIQKTVMEALSLLPCGMTPVPSTHAFDSARIGSLIKSLRQKYDYVIVDAPDFTETDIVNIAPHADELVLVTRRSHVQRESVRSAGDFFSKFKAKYVGVVVNEAEPQAIYIHAQ